MIRTNPWVIAYPATEQEEEGFIAEDLLRKKRFLLAYPDQLHALHLASQPRTLEDLISLIESSTDLTSEEAGNLVNELRVVDLLVDQDSLAITQDKNYETWPRHGWADALDYYMAIYDYPFLDYQTDADRRMDIELMAEYSAKDSIPPIFKDYPDSRLISLEKNIHALDDIEFEKVLDRDFDCVFRQDEPIPLEKLSSLLFFTLGATGRIKMPNQGDFLLKTSPSGGARHPIEAYLICTGAGVEGLSPGIYHYSVRNHALEVLQDKTITESLEEIIHALKNGPQFPVKAVIVFTGVVARSMWRYREPRTYRVLLNDMGHLSETMRLVAAALDIRFYFGHGFIDTALENLIGINGAEEPSLRFAALG